MQAVWPLLFVSAGAVASPGPISVRVIAAGESPRVQQAAESIRLEMAKEPRLVVRPAVAKKTLARDLLRPDLGPAREALSIAQQYFYRLEEKEAKLSLDRCEKILLSKAEDLAAATLLADALRLRGRVALLGGDTKLAGEYFAAASRLDPGFAPAATDWPPPARLAYNDAVAASRGAASGSLSVKVVPQQAEIFLDGKRAGVGFVTVTQLPPGLHVLAVSCLGFEPLGVYVRISDAGQIDQSSLFLTQLALPDAEKMAYAVLERSLSRQPDPSVLNQAMAIIAPDIPILVREDPADSGGEEPRLTASLISFDGKSLSARIPPTIPAAHLFAVQLLGEESPFEKNRGSGGAMLQTPWLWWAAAGVTVGVGVLTFFLTRPSEDRLTVFIGPRS